MGSTSMARAARRMTTGLTLAVAVLACGTAAPSLAPSIEPTAQPTATVVATPEPTPEPTPTVAPSVVGDGVLCAKGHEGCTISAGRYGADPFVPAFTFTVDDGWTNDRAFADGGGISRGPGGFYWASGISTGQRNGVEETFESTIEGFVEYLRGFDGFEVIDAGSAEIDGVTAVVVDVLTHEAMAPGMYFVEEDAYNLAPGEKARFYLMEIDDVFVLIVVEAWVEADFPAVEAQSQPVLDSITWD